MAGRMRTEEKIIGRRGARKLDFIRHLP